MSGIVAEHLHANAEFRTYRYPWLKRLAMRAVSHPVLAPVGVALFYGLTILATHLGRLPSFDLASDTAATIRDFWTINLGILGVQAALIGLVFPLVIAFVGLLNQGRASFASRLTIYIEASVAIFVGVSSLLLCVAIVAQLPFSSGLGGAAAAVTVLNLAWFIINAGALAYFVLRTIDFIHPARRKTIVRAYVANVVWPRELAKAVTVNRWANVAEYDYLPDGERAGPFAAGGSARTWYSAMWDGGLPMARRHLGEKMRLVEVRLAMISPVIRAWLEEARLSDNGEIHDFVIPLEPGRNYSGEQVLVRATRPLSPVGRWAMRASLKFRRPPDENGAIAQSVSIFREMVADLIALIDARQADEFSDQLAEVIAFHAFLYRLAQREVEDFNFAQLGPGGSLFDRPLSEEWARAYKDVIGRAVERLPDDAQFVGRVAHAPAQIYRRVAAIVTPKALQPILFMAQGAAYRLMDWAQGEHRSGSGVATEARQAFTVPRLEEIYARAWREFVAGWERLLEVIATAPDRRDKTARSWDDLKRGAGNVTLHLNATTNMAARAIWLGDVLATNWTCDLMLHWRVQPERAWDTRGAYWRMRTEALTLETLEHDWRSVEAMSLSHGGEAPTPKAVLGAIMHNAWRDHVVVLTNLSIHWAIYSVAAETAPQAARMLLRGEPHDRGDTNHREMALSSVDILTSGLRITGSGERYADHSYAGQIDHLLEGLGQLGDAPTVSLRIYSSSGGLSFDALGPAQVIAMMAATSGPQSIDGELRRLLTQGEDEALRRKEEYLKALLTACDALDAERHGSLLTALVEPVGTPDFEVRRDRTRQLVEQSLGVLTGHRSQAIIDAHVDPARIEALAIAAGALAFTREEFPLNFFEEIASTEENLPDFTLRVSNLSKGAYTEPPMADAAINEEEWWRNAISSQVAIVVWHDILTESAFQDLDGRTSAEFWSAFSDGSARLRYAGLDPILVVGNAEPPWLRDWRWPHQQGGAPKPPDLVITRAEDQAEGYEFSMNDIPVYQAHTAYGSAYLIPAQLLRQLRYHDYGNGVPVSLRFETEPDNPWLGTMHATFQRIVELNVLEAYRIRWADPIPTS